MNTRLIFLSPLLFVTLFSSAFSSSTCQFSLPNNYTLFKKLSKHFDKHSNTIVIEYTIRLNNGSGEFNLYKGSNSNSFEPWKWYRTQGAGNSHVLLTYDFYFGILKSILALGTRQFDINIDVQPLSCVESENFDLFIRDILIQDFKISGNSTYRAYPKADDVEVCTARIEESNGGRGELVFRCCSYDSEEKIFCDDKSVNVWGYALNIVVIVISVFLVCCFLWVVQQEHEEDVYCCSLPDDFTLKVDIDKKENTKSKIQDDVLPAETWKRMKNFKEFIDTNRKISLVYVKNVHISLSKQQLYNKLDEVSSLRELLKTLFKKSKGNKDQNHKEGNQEQKNSENNNEEQKNSENNNQEQKNSENNNQEQKNSENINQEEKNPEIKSQEKKNLENKNQEQKNPEIKSQEKKNLENKNQEQKNPEQRNQGKLYECTDRLKQYVKNFVIMAILTLPSLLFLCTMITDRFWYQQLIEAYIERGLQGPFYFQWSKFIKVQRALVLCLIVWFSCGLVLYTLFGDRMRSAIKKFIRKIKTLHNQDETKYCGSKPCNQDETNCCGHPFYNQHETKRAEEKSSDQDKTKSFGEKICNQVKTKCNKRSLWLIITIFFCIPFILFLFLGAHFILNLLVMMIFTVIVQSDIFSVFVQAILAFLIYVEVYYKDYHKRHNALKTVILNLLKDEGVYIKDKNRVSTITADVMKTKFINPTPQGEVAATNTTVSIKDEKLILKLNAPVLFLNNYDVRSISRTFLFHCCQVDCEGAPEKLDITKISLLLTATVTFIALVFLIVKAFGDIYYISPSNSFIFSFVTSLAPLVLRYINTNLSSEKMVHENDRRFQAEIVQKIKDFSEKLTISDFCKKSLPKENKDDDKDHNTGQGASASMSSGNLDVGNEIPKINVCIERENSGESIV